MPVAPRPLPMALRRNDHIVIVHGLLLGTTTAVAGALFASALLLLNRAWTIALSLGTHTVTLLDAASGLPLVSVLCLLARRASRTERAAIATTAEGRSTTHMPIRLAALDTARWFLPPRLRPLAALVCGLAARGHLTVKRLLAALAVCVLVLPSLYLITTGVVPNERDWMVLSLTILGQATVVRLQLIAVGKCLLCQQTEQSLNEVLFPG